MLKLKILKTDFNKGLLEWRLSNIAISKFFNDSKKDFFNKLL